MEGFICNFIDFQSIAPLGTGFVFLNQVARIVRDHIFLISLNQGILVCQTFISRATVSIVTSALMFH